MIHNFFSLALYVITGTRKNSARQTEYRISNLTEEDKWVRLKRSAKKEGLDFRPLRKVMEVDI
jgi:hypothetical protein